MTHSVQFTASTNCADPTILGYAITVADLAGAVLDTLTLGSGAASTAGVTHNPPATAGALPIIDVDESVIAQDVRVTFVSYETACGVATVGEFTDVKQAANAVTPSLFLSGCDRYRNWKYFEIESEMPAHRNYGTGARLFIGSDGKAYGFGNASEGGLGFPIQPQQADIRYFNGHYANTNGVDPMPLPNILFHYPDLTFHKIVNTNGTVVLLSTDGRLITYGGGRNVINYATPTAYPAIRARNQAMVVGETLEPTEVPHPAGAKWLFFELHIAATGDGAHITAYSDDGKWYAWGRGNTGPSSMGITANETAADTDTYTPTEVTTKVGGPYRAPDFSNPRVYATRIAQFRSGRHSHWVSPTDASVLLRKRTAAAAALALNSYPLPSGEDIVQFMETSNVGTFALDANGRLFWRRDNAIVATDRQSPVAGLPDGTYASFTELPNQPAGVKFVKFAISTTMGEALGDDGKIYFWTHETGPTPFPVPRNAGIVDFYADLNLNSAWVYGDGDIRFIGQFNAVYIDQDDYQLDNPDGYLDQPINDALGYSSAWRLPSGLGVLPPFLPLDCQYGRGVNS